MICSEIVLYLILFPGMNINNPVFDFYKEIPIRCVFVISGQRKLVINWNGNHKKHAQHYSVKHGHFWKDICLPLLKVRGLRWSSPFRVIVNKVSQMKPTLTPRLFPNGNFLRQSNPPAAVVFPARITRQHECEAGRWQAALTWWEKWKRKHDSPPARTPWWSPLNRQMRIEHFSLGLFCS